MDDLNGLFSGFKSLSKDEWKAIAKADLRGESFDTLIWKTYEGFDVQPFYTREDVSKINLPDAAGKDSWTTYQEIRVEDVQQANKDALNATSYDVQGLLFNVQSQVTIKKLLKGLNPSEIAISFRGNGVLQVTKDYFDFLKEEGIDPETISGFCDHDILGGWITVDEDLDFEGLADLIKLSSSAPNFKALHISSGDFINAGSNFTQELAYTMNKAVEYIAHLTEAGFTVDELVENMHFEMAITGDFFFEMAKLRAFRILAESVLRSYGITKAEIPVLASSSLWSKSRHDHHVNMIRNTTEAMSGILGGADAILIRVHNDILEQPTPFSQRIASNISNLLRTESHLDKVNNPVAGTYYVESITSDLAQSALDVFKETEEAGGLISSIRSGNTQRQIREVRKRKEKDLLDEKFIMVGTNRYLVGKENTVNKKNRYKEFSSDGRELLFPRSLAEVQETKKKATK